MLEVEGLSVSYDRHRALDGVGLRVAKGEIVVILGANGAGKTTLLKAICGISEGRVGGSVRIDGAEVLGLAPNRIVEEGIALVPEGRGVFPDMTVEENLRLGAYASRARDAEAASLERVQALFPKLRERRHQVVRTMSGGEQQMVAIGRAMMSNPSILALDEPSLGLSPLLAKELFRSLHTVRDAGIGMLLVEQNARQSLAIADRGYLLENGRIVHEDHAKALLRDPMVQEAYLGAAGSATGAAARPGSMPVPATPRPRSVVSDIAAAALGSVRSRTVVPPVPATPVPVAMRPRLAEPVDIPRAPPIAPQATLPRNDGHAPRPAGKLPGIDLGDLVARARAKSDRRPPAPEGSGRLPTVPEGQARHPVPRPASPSAGQAAPTIPRTPMPDLGSSTDRLRSALAEIEEAARRAERYRPARKP